MLEWKNKILAYYFLQQKWTGKKELKEKKIN